MFFFLKIHNIHLVVTFGQQSLSDRTKCVRLRYIYATNNASPWALNVFVKKSIIGVAQELYENDDIFCDKPILPLSLPLIIYIHRLAKRSYISSLYT